MPEKNRREGPGLADWLIVFLLAGAAIFSFVDRFVLSLLTEPIKHDLGLSDVQLGLLSGVGFGLFYATLGLPLGWLADRWSRKGTIVGGIAIWSAATALCGFAANFTQLMIGRIGVGAGEAALVPSSYAIIHDRFSRGRLNLAFAVFQIGGLVGAGLAMLTAGIVYAYFVAGGGAWIPFVADLRPWQQTFVVAALPGVLFVIAFLVMKETRRLSGARSDDGVAIANDPLARIGVYALLFVGMAGLIACSYAMMSWFPAILSRELHWSPKRIGLLYGLTLLVVAPAGVLSGGFIADALHKRGRQDSHVIVPLATACLSIPLFALFEFASGGAQLLVSAGCLHYVLGLPLGVAPALIQRITPVDRRSRTSAVYVLCCNAFGTGIGPVMIGWLSGLGAGSPHPLRTAVCVTASAAALMATILLFRLRSAMLGPDAASPSQCLPRGDLQPQRRAEPAFRLKAASPALRVVGKED